MKGGRGAHIILAENTAFFVGRSDRAIFAKKILAFEILSGKEGGFTLSFVSNREMSIYDAAMEYKENNIPLIVIAGKEYGTGSSRDWAAKGVSLLGIKAVLFETVERIHRTNLIGMGILPLQFTGKDNAKNLKITATTKNGLKMF